MTYRFVQSDSVSAAVIELLQAAKCEESLMAPSRQTRYWLLYDDDQPVGVCGLLRLGGVFRFKSDYVVPGHRRQGIGRLMIVERIDIAMREGAVTLEASCTPASVGVYRSMGFDQVKEYGNGATLMRRQV